MTKPKPKAAAKPAPRKRATGVAYPSETAEARLARGRIKLTLELPVVTRDALRGLAAERGLSVGGLVTAWVEEAASASKKTASKKST